jgi:hypothetical protein
MARGWFRRTIGLPVRRFQQPVTGRLDHVQVRVDEVSHHVLHELAQLQHLTATNLQEIYATRHHLNLMLVQELDAGTEATTLLSRGLSDTREAIDEAVDTLREEIGKLTSVPSARRVEELDGRAAALLDHAEGPSGFRAQRGLPHDAAVQVRYGEGALAVEGVSAGLVESAFVMRALAAVAPGARVLDLGPEPGSRPLALASLGYRVTVLAPAPAPVPHPNLRHAGADPGALDGLDPFDAVVWTASAAARPPDLDAARDRVAPGGLLVAGLPFDRQAIHRLAPGFDVLHLAVVRRIDATTWLPVDAELADDRAGEEQVALVTARRLP